MARPQRMTTRLGIRLWTIKQAPFFDSGSGWTYDFDPGDITFTPKMDKRPAPGPFANAPIVQGSWSGAGTGDICYFGQGDLISGDFRANIDANQGAISVWITPEWDGDDGIRHRFLRDYAYVYFEKRDDDRLYFEIDSNNLTMSVDVSGWTAGTKYHVLCRWDMKNTLDGTNYACISINDAHTFGETTVVPIGDPITVEQTMGIGGYRNLGTGLADAILEGMTIWRRPLWDGAYGINANGVDEVNAIWAAGAGKDPCLVTGSWDVCFCLPTNSAAEELVTGTGEAWSHPHGSNLLGVGGFMMDGDYSTDGWTNEGSILDALAIPTAEKIFNGGYRVGSDDINEGLYKDYTCSAGDSFVIRALAHSDGASIPKIILYDQTNTAEIANLIGSNASTRTAPDVFIFTGTAPAGCTTIRVKLIDTNMPGPTDNTYWHQCELLQNLVTCPSMETGAGDPWLPTAWSPSALVAGDTVQELVTVHSGGSSLQYNSGHTHSGPYSNNSATVGKFCARGYWHYGDGSANVLLQAYSDMYAVLHSSTTLYQLIPPVTAAWTHTAGVFRVLNSSKYINIKVNGVGSGDRFVDDLYTILMDDVSLTVTPASEANCQENGGIRVSGRSTCIKDITGILGRTSGALRFKWTPRHSAGKFTIVQPADVNIAYFPNDSSNYINLYHEGSNSIRIYFRVGAVGTISTWNAVGNIAAGSTYSVEIRYNSTTCTVKIDGVQRLSVSPVGGIDFGANIPDTANLGSNGSSKQNDAVFSAP